MQQYLPRIVDRELALRLEAFGATLIVGPKWCGKTTTGQQQAKSILRMQDPDKKAAYLATAEAKPSLLLKGDNPRLIDEWQIAPVLWDAVRTAVDIRQEEGLFILTGSTSVDDKKIMHTGTGRIARLKMYPMSLYESGESNGQISLKTLFDQPDADITYTQNGDYLIPNIVIRKTKPLGHYGRLRKAYLEMHRPILFNELALSDKLFEHCAEIDEAARSRMELIVPELAKQYGVTEQLKAENQMEWVRQMNACKAQAEEVVKAELIYN